jgi:hypothetical protein
MLPSPNDVVRVAACADFNALGGAFAKLFAIVAD